MAEEQVDTSRGDRDGSAAGDLVEEIKDLVGMGDADDDDGDQGGSEEPDSRSAGIEAGGGAQVDVGVGASVDGELHGTIDGGGATTGAGVDGTVDTGLGGEYDGSVDGEMSVDPGAGSVEGAVDVSIGRDDPLSGRLEGDAGADVQFGPTSFGVGAEASLTQTDPFGIDTGGVSAGGSYHHDVGADGVEAGAGLEGTVDTWAGDEYHGEAEANLGFGQGAADVDGSVGLTHTAPFGVASQSFEAEGQGHVDGEGWTVDADVGYEVEVGGTEVGVGGGLSTSGEWSDAEDAANDAGDAVGGAAEDTGDAIGGAAEDTGDAIGGLIG
ncbi:MAG: hypothetical protein ACT4PI_06315 [Actinomycetota bacterium]